MMSKLLFKKLSVFSTQDFSFTLNFPDSLWIYKKVSKNQFWFINKENNQALILEYFNDKVYDYEILKNELGNVFSLTKIGDYDALLKCKNFVEYSIMQYEWVMVDLDMKIRFSYPILKEKSEEDKDKDYKEVCSILNSLKNKNVGSI